jgi:hypothetical protein
LIAWEKVRQRRDQGGLGIKDLAVQNTSFAETAPQAP